MTPDVVRRQGVLEEHDLAADGAFAVVICRFVAGRRYRSHLWLVPLRGGQGRVRRLTDGDVRDSRPRISPDGRRVAFLRSLPADRDAPTRLLVLDLDPAARAAGEPWSPAAFRHGVSAMAWSPEGDRLAVVAGSDPPRFIVGRETRGETPTARRIDRLDWRMDEVGHRDRPDHLFVVRARPAARVRRLTDGSHDVRDPAWSLDGRYVLYAADPRPDADLSPRATIWRVAVRGGEPAEVVDLAGFARAPVVSPDGRWVACIGIAEPEPLDDVSPGVFVAPAGGGPAIALAPSLDRPVGAWPDTDLTGWMTDSRPGPAWADARTVVAVVSTGTSARPWRFPIDPVTGGPAGPPAPLVEDESVAWTLAVATAGRRRPALVSVVGTLAERPMELMTVALPALRQAADGGAAPQDPGRYRTRTVLGSAWRRGLRWPVMRRLALSGPDGPIEAWLASPPSAGDDPLPLVVDIHGGPLGAWSGAPSLEVGILASHGYRVLLPNIRGSTGYGAAWIQRQLGDWGGIDAADTLAALDEVIGLGLADPARLGLLGLSYGGFLVQWLVGAAPGRFAAAVAENGVANQVGAWANSDTGVEYNRASLLGDPLTRDGMERLWRQSPLSLASNIRTPLLMLQAEADRRCPPADNEQLFVALRVLRRPVEYVLYPDESHVYQATGRPDRRIDRHARMLAWFERWMPAG